ncbi:MAG: hypothetical protein FIB06_00335 [Betaproteobacteria bacterium]|nr:hypothetical protein [Betaproteobacteria bacterium]
MISGAAGLLRGLGIAILVVGWAVAAHLASAGNGHRDLAVAVALGPLAALAIILLWRLRPAIAAVTGLALAVLAAWLWPLLREHVAWLYFLQHLGTNLALAALFGLTLRRGEVPLVTRFARLAHGGDVSATKERYTRSVTLAWTLFFLACATISAALFLFAPTATWSVFANFLTLPLVATMFAAEHLVRQRVLPPGDSSSVADTIRGYRAAMRGHPGSAGKP